MLWCFYILLTALILSTHPKPAEIPSKQTQPMDSSSLLPSLLCLLCFRTHSEISWCQLTCLPLQTPRKGPQVLTPHPSGQASFWLWPCMAHGELWSCENNKLPPFKSCSLLLWLHCYRTLLNSISLEQQTCDNNVSTSSPGPAEQRWPWVMGHLDPISSTHTCSCLERSSSRQSVFVPGKVAKSL